MTDFCLFGSMSIALSIVGLSVCLGPRCCIYPHLNNNVIILTYNLFFEKVLLDDQDEQDALDEHVEELQPLLS